MNMGIGYTKDEPPMDINSAYRLANGVEIPRLGLGVYKVGNDEVAQVVKWALQAGYRSIDTASFYANEAGVGQGVRQSGVDRRDVFITSKVWNSEQGYNETLAAFELSIQRLGVDYLDLCLIHWPVAGRFKHTWQALQKLYEDKRVRAIGVSNFQTHHLDDLLAEAEIAPMVNQVELHPWLSQVQLKAYCRERNIAVEAWAPLARGKGLNNPILDEIALRYGKNAVQVILRWHLQNNTVVIPKSVRHERIIANADIFDFDLSPADMELINGLNRDMRLGPDPDHFDF